MDFLANQILLPLGGMLIAIFVGWYMNKNLISDELGNVNPILIKVWRFFVKFVAPISVAAIFYNALFG
jgi:NSS family neurotransmitter:Na+ symporter